MSTAPIDELLDPDRAEDSVRYAYRALRDQILGGDLEPGAVLSQVRLAKDLGISRTPLREALRRLVAEHLVTGDFNHRMRVSELHLDDFDQIYAMRIALEPVGLAATLPIRRDDHRVVLAEHLDRMGRAIDVLDLERFRHEHRAFHLGLTAGSGSRMHAVLADLVDQSDRYRLAFLQRDPVERDGALLARLHASQQEHSRILDAALSGDATACAEELVAHLQHAADAVFRESRRVPGPRMVSAAVQASSRSGA